MTNLKSLEISAKVHLAGVESVIKMVDDIENNSLMTVEISEMKNIIKEIKAVAAKTENKKYKTFLNQMIKDCEAKIYKTVDK